jgi:signal transduction histidine kinase
LRIRDNGPGMAATNAAADTRTAPDARSADPGPHGHGLLGMRERAQSVGGELRAGPAVGGGFLVQATLPVTGQPAGIGA